MKKPLLYILFSFALASFAKAQKISSADLKILKKKEDSLKTFARTLNIDSLTANRMRSDSFFIKTLLRSIHVNNSFYFPFDSVKGIGKLYAPDSTFRIITWSLAYSEDFNSQRGVIQFNTPDGSARFIPLIDNSHRTPFPEDSVRGPRNWIGAIYYNIVQTKHNGKNYYTLFGYDPHGIRSNKKWIEVMTFDANQIPVFGGQYFSFEQDSVKRPVQIRYSIEYKKEASSTVNYDPELKLILVDHLVSETDEPELPFTFVPDGDYEGFKWLNGKWVHVDKVFHEKLQDGQAPVPDPIRDLKGLLNEEKLKQQSEKNKGKKKDGE